MTEFSEQPRSWLNVIRSVARELPPSVLSPRALFIAASDVITLAFEGFSIPLHILRGRLEQQLSDVAPPTAGSLWPKTTLAARATPALLNRTERAILSEICLEWSANLLADSRPLSVDQLTFVLYRMRSLEDRMAEVSIDFGGGAPVNNVHPESRAYVNTILSSKGHSSASNPAKSDVTYYRAFRTEYTLIADWKAWRVAHQDEFKQAVDTALPGRYAWFNLNSLHVTIRSLGRMK